MKKILWVFFVSMLPIIELRGGILIGDGMGLDFWTCYLVCVIGNLLPVPFLILFSKKVLMWFSKKRDIEINANNWFESFFKKALKWFGGLCHKIIIRADEKAKKIGTYELLGIYLFVAIPIPGTGAWTGSLISAVLRLRMAKAFVAIALGVITSGLIMGIVSYGILGGLFGII
jgi:uncharacterized membrane protein